MVTTCTFPFAGRQYQILRSALEEEMRHWRLRVELRLDGDLKARYQDRYVEVGEDDLSPIRDTFGA